MNEHIISVQEVRDMGRPISPKIDEEKLQSYIYETERLTLKPMLGDELFKRLVTMETDETKGLTEEALDIILNGGEYTDCRGRLHIVSGLKVAVSYFVYAQYVMDGDFQLTRAGVVVKDGAYSQHVSSKERSDCYNNALTAARGFLDEVVSFIRRKLPAYTVNGRAGSSLHKSIIIKKIG
ncbi:MAG: hypothetical protein IJ551_06080 [Prevotella sp.]|nr:hypothetical protein [Prevotella sp.]